MLSAAAARRSLRGTVAAITVVALTALLSLVGVAPAQAAAVATIMKQLDTVQSTGFTAPNTFEAGSLVRYRLAYQCASLTEPCVTGTITDVLDANLDFVQVVVPSGNTTTVTSSYDSTTRTVTANISNFQDGTGGELVLIARVKPTAPAGSILNDATISIPQAEPVTTPEVEIIVPDREPKWSLSKTKTAPSGSPSVDGTVTYRLQLGADTTVGNVNIQVGTIVDTFPDGAIVLNADGGTVDYATNTITWNVGVVSVTAAWSKTITLSYPSTPREPGEPVFETGQTVVNVVDADVTYENGDEGDLHAERPVTLVAPVTNMSANKTTDTPAVTIGGEIRWDASGFNGGNTTLVNAVVTDTPLPTGITNLRIRVAPQSPDWPQMPTTYEQLVGGVWVPLAVYTGSNSFTTAVNPAATGVRAYPTSGVVPAGMRFGEIYFYGTVTNPADPSIQNCIAITADGVADASDCATSTVTSEQASLTITKIHILPDPTQVTVQPGDTFRWAFGVRADASQGTVDRLTITDVLPAGFTYVDVYCVGYYGTGGGNVQGIEDGCNSSARTRAALLPEPTFTPDIDGNGGTGITWDIDFASLGLGPIATSDIFMMHLRVTANEGLPIGPYTNRAYVSSPELPTVCRSGGTTDVNDVDLDGDRTDTVCTDPDTINVAAAAIISAAKYDQGVPELGFVDQGTGQPNAACPDVDGFTRYPCVAQTTPGGPLSYLFALKNIGNVAATDYVMYDILPTTGDTGVSQTLAGTARGTEWVPQLTGPVTVVAAPDAAQPAIEYSLSSNPCRPELNQGSADGSWQASCDDEWFTAGEIEDWATVKSFRLSAFAATGAAWEPLAEMVLRADLRAPIDAPQSTEQPLDLSIAWNSFAHREHRLNADGSTERLLPSEPRKVGIIVPFVLPDVYAVGDYVWFDDDKDGVQDAGELPVEGVTVTLLNPDGTRALDANGFEMPATTTDANGHYVFDNLAAGSYAVQFSDLPADYQTTAQTTGGDQSTTSDSNPPAGATGSATTPVFVIGDGLAGMTPVEASDGTTVAVAINRTIDAGIHRVPPVLYAVGDYVWIDADRDGIQDAGETPVPNVTVVLLTESGAVVATTTTDAAGHYVFDALPAGTYSVRFVGLPDGYITTAQTTGGDPTAPADSNVPAGLAGAATTPPFSLGAGIPGMALVELTDGVTVAATINRTIDAGIVLALYAVGDYVWIDTNRDGRQDATEVVVAGVTVELLDASGVVVGTTTTDANGHYVFDGIPAGEYSVRFSDLPAGYKTTEQLEGGDQAIGDDSNGPANLAGTATTPSFTIGGSAPGMAPIEPSDGTSIAIAINRTIDLGLVQVLYAVGDYVWVDTDRDGIQDAGEAPVPGVTVTLLDADGEVVATTTTDENGHYVFDSLPPGRYRIEFSDIRSPYLTTTQNDDGDQAIDDDSNTPGGLGGTATTPWFTLGPDESGMTPVEPTDGVDDADTINRTIDMGLVLAPVVSPETPETPTPAAPLAHTGLSIGASAGVAAGLLGAGLLLMVVLGLTRRSGRRAE